MTDLCGDSGAVVDRRRHLGRRLCFIFVAAWLCFFLIACVQDDQGKQHTLRGEIFGTHYVVKYAGGKKTPSKSIVERSILTRLEAIDAVMSTWKEDSELSRLNRAAPDVAVKLSEELQQILLLSLRLHQQTQGAFDITVGPLVNLWGFGPDGKWSRLPDEALIQATKEKTGVDKLRLDASAGTATKKAAIYLDLSAIAKGYAVDEVGAALQGLGARDYLVEIGGELLAHGSRPGAKARKQEPWRIAIEAPVFNEREVQRIVRLKNLAMATSGDYRNYFEADGVRYSHIIDPSTGRPAQHTLASVTVLHPQTVIADAWATALLVLGEEDGKALAEQQGLAAYFIRREADGFVESWSTAFAPLLRAPTD